MLRPVFRSGRFLLGLTVLGLTLLAALAGAFLAGDPFRPTESILSSPSTAHVFGTDELGRDIATRILHGAATALLVAIPTALVAALVGTAAGLAGGFYGGIFDEVLLKVIEFVLVVPRFLLALVVAALFGSELWLVGAVLAFTFWPHTARLVRGDAISIRERPFVEAATAAGASDLRIMARHMLPLALPVIAVNTSFQAGQAVLIESGLAFLGVGDRDVVSWGAMLADAQSYLALAWWTSFFPGITLALLILALNLLGDGLADSWNVRSSGRA